MPKRYIRNLLSISVVTVILALLILPITVAVGAATWEFRYPVFITDNTSTARTNVPVVTGMNGQSFIDAGKINANGLNTNFQQGSTDLKYMIADNNITVVVPNLPSNSMATTNFYTGYAPEQTDFEIITGVGGYVTQADNWSLELTRPLLHFINLTPTSDLDVGTIHLSVPTEWVSIWFQFDSTFIGADAHYLASQNNGGADYFHMRWLGAGNLQFQKNTGGGEVTINAKDSTGADITSWQGGQWYHALLITSAADGVSLIINGDGISTHADVTASPSGAALTFGNETVGGNSGFPGYIANIAVGTDDLTTAEKTALYTSGINGAPPADANNWWRINEGGTETTIIDYGTDGDNGTAGAATSWNDNPGFEVSTTAYINTDAGADKYIIRKPSAFEIEVARWQSGNITARIIGGTLADNVTYMGSNDNVSDIFTTRLGQTFVPDNNMLVTSVNLTLKDNGAGAGNLYVAIVGTTGGAPNQSDNITQGVLLNSETAIGAVAANYTVNVTPAWLSANTSYAIVAWNTVVGIVASLDNTAPTYFKGWFFGSADSGATWVTNTGQDWNFEVNSRLDAVSATGVSSGERKVLVENLSDEYIDFPVHGAEYWALHFDGTAGSNVNMGAVYSAAPKITVAFWFELDAPITPALVGDRWMTTKLNGADHFIIEFKSGDGSLRFRSKTGGVQRFDIETVKTNWAADTWFFVLASTSNTSGQRLKIDDGAAVTAADTNAIVNGGTYYIDRPAGPSFEGHIVNYLIFTDDLTLAEETALYLGTYPGDESDNWYLDEGLGLSATSLGSLATAGTIGAANTWQMTDRPNRFGISIDGVIGDNGLSQVVTVPDTADNWTYLYQGGASNDWIPYTYSVNVSVSGNASSPNTVHFQPNTMIIGSNLTNRALLGNPGTIIWGSNPAGEIIVSYGAMVGFAGTTAPSGTAGTENVPAVPMPPNWFATGNETSNLPFYDMVSLVVSSMDFPDHDTGVQTIYFWWIIGTSFALYMLMLATTRSMVFALIAFEVPLIVGSQQTIVPTWLPVAVALLSISILMLYHKLSR